MNKKMSRSCRAHLEEQLIALEIELNIFYLQTKRVVTRYKKIVNDRKGVTKGFLSLDQKTAAAMSRVMVVGEERHEKLVFLVLHSLEETSDFLATTFENYIRARKRLSGMVPSYEETKDCV
jgi:hypothetical protein